MSNEELKKQFKDRDRVVRVLSKDGTIRASMIKNTNTTSEAQRRHELDFASASLLARSLTAASLIASFLKGEERIIVEFDSNGPISKIYSEALSVGEVRGFINHSKDYDPNAIKDFRELIGIGLLKVSRILSNKNEPVEGIVPIQVGDISTDLAYYFTQSEQIPSAVILDLTLSEDGFIESSGGLIVQALPGADPDELESVINSLEKENKIQDLLNKGYDPEEILKIMLPFEFDVIKNTQTDFFCRCSKDNFKSKLLTLGYDELKDMKEQQQNELVCQFCNEKYILDDRDFEELLNNSKASIN